MQTSNIILLGVFFSFAPLNLSILMQDLAIVECSVITLAQYTVGIGLVLISRDWFQCHLEVSTSLAISRTRAASHLSLPSYSRVNAAIASVSGL